jgi:hypothetical protein
MQDLTEFIAPEFHEAVRRFGFNKIAAKMYGVEEIDAKTASEIIGAKMMTRLAEWRQIQKGLSALTSLTETDKE